MAHKLRQCRLCTTLLVCLFVFLSPSVQALTLHYDPLRAEELIVCDRLLEKGEQEEADSCFNQLQDADDLLIRAEAARALDNVKLANRLFREASEASDNPYALARWGQLFLSTHQISDAAALFRESLVMDPSNLEARLGLAEAQGRRFQGEARQTLYDVLRSNPDSLRALVLLARIELELQRLEEAEGLLLAAEELANQLQASPIEIYALRASLDLLNGITESEWTQKALELNPRYGDIYAIPSHFYIITYRYREAVELYQKAVEIDPGHAAARSKLGINLLRINDVFGARYHLGLAYETDPYNTETVNTLRLLDDMDDMQFSFVDVLDENDQPMGRVLFKLDVEDVGALEPYVKYLSEKAVRVLTERYDFKLKKPVTVELYHNHDDFGVRTVSTPGVGLLGVTFGYLLAMDSPKARAKGDFHWGSTLWHELAHVFTLEAANHLLPRWYSEGLSVYEEWHTGPLVNRELPIRVLQMLEAGRFLPISDLDSGFVRPTYDGQVNVSYMQAGLVCTYIAERWGHQALVDMLKAFGRGETTPDVIEQYLKVSPEQFDESFVASIKNQYAFTLANLTELTRQEEVIGRAVTAEDWARVQTLAERRIEIYPAMVGAGNGYTLLARAQREQGDDDGAVETLLRWHALGGYEPVVLTDLASELERRAQIDDAIAVLESLNWVNPYQSNEHYVLGTHYLKAEQPQLAIREFNALIGSSEALASSAWLGKGRAYQQLGDRHNARRSVLLALEQAPYFREAQHLLLELNPGEHLD